MDRERKDELPQMQVGFIDVICLPLYKVIIFIIHSGVSILIAHVDTNFHMRNLLHSICLVSKQQIKQKVKNGSILYLE